MTTSLLLISDTHVPQRARGLSPEVWAEVEGADVVVHAGDWNRIPLLDEFEARSRRLIAVRGNNDGPEFLERLPEVARAEIEGVRIAVVHETGPAAGRETRCDAAFPDVDLLVFGHSHIPWDSTSQGGMRLLNPGSPSDRRRQPECTIMRVELADGRVARAELIAVPR